MPPLSPARVLLSLLPAVVIVITAASALFGDGGLLVHAQLRQRRDALNAEIVALSKVNACLLREISVLRSDPEAMRREAADTLGRAEPGAILYSFDDASAGSRCAAVAPQRRHTGVLDSPR